MGFSTDAADGGLNVVGLAASWVIVTKPVVIEGRWKLCPKSDKDEIRRTHFRGR